MCVVALMSFIFMLQGSPGNKGQKGEPFYVGDDMKNRLRVSNICFDKTSSLLYFNMFVIMTNC